MYYTYIVECADKSLYTGFTDDPDKRMAAHNAGEGAKYTRSRRPVELKYFEEFETKSEACRREYAIKQLSRDKKLWLIQNKDVSNICLIGFMGVGKSAVSGELFNITKRKLYDTDEVIVSREGRSIPEIFSADGEDYFRSVESKVVADLSAQRGRIISCGGGVATRQNNVDVMRSSGVIVLLTAKPKTILKRVGNDKNRPLLKDRKTPEAVAELMASRLSAYESAADITVATDDLTPQEVAKKIVLSVAKFNR